MTDKKLTFHTASGPVASTKMSLEEAVRILETFETYWRSGTTGSIRITGDTTFQMNSALIAMVALTDA